MAFDMSLFAANALNQQWSLQNHLGLSGMLNQFPPAVVGGIGGPPAGPPPPAVQHAMVTGMMGGQVVAPPPPQAAQQQQQLVQQQQQVQMAMADGPKADTIHGYGILTWLSAKAGLITCKNKMVISFQLKDFCDQMLNDLTSVLRVGFTLSFNASLNETSEYTATIVQPIYGADAEMLFLNSVEVDLEAANPTPPNSKDAYSPTIEARAIPALMAIFQRHGLQQIQLSSLHSQMSNCGDDELFRYVGTSSLKRRQFVERRTHIFRLQNDDSIILQYPAVYMGVYKLASFLLRHGGATSIQSLFDYYVSPDVSQEIRDCNGDGRQDFLNLLQAHNWVFSLFPNRTYVSVRRNLPRYDYPGFIKQHFPDMEISRARIAMNQMAYGQQQQQQQPRGIQRTMSAQMTGSYGGSQNGAVVPPQPQRQQSMLLQQTQSIGQAPQQQKRGAGGAIGMWDATQAVNSGVGNGSTNASGGQAVGENQWSPLFSPPAWSNGNGVNPLQNLQFNDINGAAALSSLLALSQQAKQMTSIGTQSEMSIDKFMPIGYAGCTCNCNCGARAAFYGSAGVIGGRNRGSSSRASGGSATPPSYDSNSPFDRFSPMNGIGSIGDRLSSNNHHNILQSNGTQSDASTSSNSAPAPPAQRYYDPFGTAEILNGSHFGSMRIGH